MWTSVKKPLHQVNVTFFWSCFCLAPQKFLGCLLVGSSAATTQYPARIAGMLRAVQNLQAPPNSQCQTTTPHYTIPNYKSFTNQQSSFRPTS